MSSTEIEGQWLALLGNEDKAIFLAQLGHTLTIAGRSTYEAGTDRLCKPEHLRKINEIMHRVLSCLRQVLEGEGNESFERSIATWVLEQSDSELRELMRWAWFSTKESGHYQAGS